MRVEVGGRSGRRGGAGAECCVTTRAGGCAAYVSTLHSVGFVALEADWLCGHGDSVSCLPFVTGGALIGFGCWVWCAVAVDPCLLPPLRFRAHV